jgi:hypothetical protein
LQLPRHDRSHDGGKGSVDGAKNVGAKFHGASSRRGAVAATIGLFAFCLLAFAASPVTTSWDSVLSIYTAMSFAHGHDGDLTEYQPKAEELQSVEYPDGRPRSRYPIGPSLLAAPAVAAYAWLHPHFSDELRKEPATDLEKAIASIIGAAAVVVFFRVILCEFDSVPVALSAALIFAFCTSIWSTATRALWQHGPLVLMLSIAMLLLARTRRRPELVQYVGVPLALAYVMRPTASLPIAVISLYVLIYHRAFLARYLFGAALVAMPWLAYNLSIYHALLPDYYVGGALAQFSPQSRVWDGLLGTLFSPSRGLFIYSPVLLFALSGFALALREPQQRPLHIAYGAIVAVHTTIMAATAVWWAGHSFGPRYLTDIIPFLVYFTAFNLRLPAGFRPRTQFAAWAGIAILAAASAFVNAQGALRPSTSIWNAVPDDIDYHPARLWDWGDPQFARTKATARLR